MLFFHSGISTPATAEMLAAADGFPLVDPVDLPNVEDWDPEQVALDSGAYRNFTQGIIPDDALHAQHVAAYGNTQHCFRLMLDTVGDPDATLAAWRQHYGPTGRFTPVYQWGAPREHLEEYLASAPMITLPHNGLRTHLVAIGGMARILRGGHREKNAAEKRRLDAERDRAIAELEQLAGFHRLRFHVLGLNSLKAISSNRLRTDLACADSSKWLDGGRYAYIAFVDTRTGELRMRPAATFGDPERIGDPERTWTREQRCQHNIKSIDQYCVHTLAHTITNGQLMVVIADLAAVGYQFTVINRNDGSLTRTSSIKEIKEMLELDHVSIYIALEKRTNRTLYACLYLLPPDATPKQRRTFYVEPIEVWPSTGPHAMPEAMYDLMQRGYP